MIRTVESPPPASAPVLAAYSYCEAVTGQQARNFAYGIRLLPTPKRRAMSALYAFSRRVDDIGDGALAADVKVTRLEDTRTLLDRVRAGKVEEDDTDPVAVALSHAASAFPIPLGGLDELIDGVLMDVRGETYETWDDLKVYCRCVAGAIGRLSLGVFGTEAGARGTERAAEYADTLGLALQLTNILRDVREDAEGAAPTCRRTTWRSSAAPPGSTGPPRPRAPTSRASSTSRCAAPAPCSPRATGCCPCSTGAAGPVWPPWPASTAVCWTASSATPRPSCAAGSRCPAGRRPTSRCAACPAWTPGTSPAARPSGRQPGGGPDGRAGRRSGPGRSHRRGTAGNPALRRGVPEDIGRSCRVSAARPAGRGGRTMSDGTQSPGAPIADASARAGRGGPADGTTGRDAVVVGGGLAGITAALALADAGVRVTLLEGRPRLGGLAFSFRRGDLTVDNGQHVYLRCCTAYRWFLDRIEGSALAPLQDRLDVPVVDVAKPEGRRLGRLRRDALPVPLHLGRGLATYPHLSLAERARVGRAALALKALDLTDPALDTQDFGTWLTAHGQSARAVEALWDLVGVATLNAVAGDASLALAAMVFKTGLLSDPGAADIGWARVPLGELHDRLTRKALDSAGVRTEVRTRVTSLSRNENGSWSVEVPGETLHADAVVLAVPQRETHDLLPAGALDAPERLLALGTAPILNVHVVYDRKVLAAPFLAALGTPCSGCSTAPTPPGCARASTSRCPSRPRRTRSTPPWPCCASATCPSWSGCCPRPAAPGCRTSSSPGSAPRRSPPPPAPDGSGPAPAPRHPACTWPGRGPPPGGPRPWRVRSAAA